jgi:outer membrane protein assembly factor BamD
MKKIVLIIIAVVSLVSCGEYQKVLNKGTVKDQYKMAENLFNEGEYKKALTLFEKVIPNFRGKPQMQRIQFMVAKSDFEIKNYELSAYHFNRFINNFPKSSKMEEAEYLVAQSYYLASPRFSLDQKDTDKALGSLQNFLDKYPDSEHASGVNKQYRELTIKLEKKAFEIAKQYYHTGYYKAALVAFDNFMADYLGSKYKEDALYYKFKSANDLAINSVPYKKVKRIEGALKAYNRLMKYYPESKFKSDSDDLLKKLKKELVITKALNIKQHDEL